MNTLVLGRQGLRFLVVGVIQLGVDTLVFALLHLLGTPIAAANVLGRVGATLLGFLLHRHYTFAATHALDLKRQLVRYLVVWLGLTLLSTLGVGAWAALLGTDALVLGKVAVEIGCAMLSFVLLRTLVYR